jgi:hypothetical protein
LTAYSCICWLFHRIKIPVQARITQRSQRTPSRLLQLILTVTVKRVERLYCLQKEGLAKQKINKNEKEHVWLKRHRFVTDNTRSKHINGYQQVTAVEHVIHRGCSIVSIAPLPQCTSFTPPHSKCPRDVS